MLSLALPLEEALAAESDGGHERRGADHQRGDHAQHRPPARRFERLPTTLGPGGIAHEPIDDGAQARLREHQAQQRQQQP
jgi:hypothetical protein